MTKKLLLLLLAILFFIACGKKNENATVTTFAGTGIAGAVNCKASAASFSNLMGLAIDSVGNLYVADSRNHQIRKVSADGVVTTLAGSGKDGSADGQGNSASFFFPVAVAISADGNVYVADTHNSLIRKIKPDGVVSTLAGRLAPDSKSDPNSLQRIDNPYGIAVGKDGSVYFTDWGKDVVRKVNPKGIITIVAGNGTPGSNDGTGASASFYLPEGIAIDANDNLYIADSYNNMIRKISPAGAVTTLAGKKAKGSADGKGSAASFLHPCGIAVDAKGNLYVADAGNNKIRKITPDGTVTTLAGTGARGSTNASAIQASFNRPYGVAVDKAGNVYVADYQNNLIRKIGF